MKQLNTSKTVRDFISLTDSYTFRPVLKINFLLKLIKFKCNVIPDTTLGPSSTLPPVGPPSCEPLSIRTCQGLGYTHTAASHMFGGLSQSDRARTIQQLAPLININCSPDLKRLVCSLTSPKCDPVTNVISLPCRSLCESAKKGCNAAFWSFGSSWPPSWNCTSMPERGCVQSSSLPTIGNVEF